MGHYDEQREQHEHQLQQQNQRSSAEYDFHLAAAINSLNKAKSCLSGLTLDANYKAGARQLAKVCLAAEILQEQP